MEDQTIRSFRRIATVLAIGLLVTLPAFAQEELCQDGVDNDGDSLTDGADTDCQCLEDATGISGCTANDVSFVLVGLGVQQDGCISPGDTLAIDLGADLRTTAATRYDLGMWVALDGGDALRAGPEVGLCARQILRPVSAMSPNPGNPAGTGPFVDSDGDVCGELRKTDPDARYLFPFTTFFPCEDEDANGFVDIATCFSYAQNANTVCSDLRDAIPGTSSKCGCEELQSNVPVPNMGLTCNCTETTIAQGESTTCTVTYTNSSMCTPDLTTEERFRCGTASFLRFETSYDDTRGSISGTPSVSATGSATDNGSGLITWLPRNQITGGSQGVIGPNGQTETLTFTYTADPDVTNGTANITTRTYWSNISATDGSAIVQDSLVCSFDITTTPVTLAWVSVEEAGGGATVEWQTATETANAGFRVFTGRPPIGSHDQAKAAMRQAFDRDGEGFVPSAVVSSTEPQSYRFDLTELADGDVVWIEDVGLDGRATRHGPFQVGGEQGRRPEPEPVDWQAVRGRTALAVDVHGRGLGLAVAAAKAGNGGASADPAVEMVVDETGIHRVTFEQLAAGGFDFSGVRDRDLALVGSDGSQVPLRVVATGNGGKLAAGSFVEFWGEALDGLYTGSEVYRLEVRRNGALPLEVDATPAGAAPAAGWYLERATTERNRFYSINAPGSDPWVDTQMLAFGSPRGFDFDLEVDGHVAGTGAEERLAVELWGITDWESIDPDHHAVVKLNGTPVADVTFDGSERAAIDVALPPGLLQEGVNDLRIELPADTGAASDVVVLESWTATYPRGPEARDGRLTLDAAGEAIEVGGLADADAVVYRLGGAGPVHLAGAATAADGAGWSVRFAGTGASAAYAVASASSLLTPELRAWQAPPDLLAGEARWLAISHPAFLDALAPLAAARAAEGWSVDTVDVRDVYATYSGGVVDAAAIRRYVADAAAARGTEMVVLVGGDSYDYRDFLGVGSVSFVPTLYVPSSDFINWAPSDSLYGDLDGDLVPELAVGRLPARTPEELEVLVDKILTYATKDYGRTAVVAADRFDAANAISFISSAEAFLNSLGSAAAPWTADRVYLDNLTVAGAKARLTQGIELGAALTSYVGHSGPTVWSFSGLFNGNDAANLGNAGRPTVALQWGCWNTYHVQPSYNTLGHRLLLSGDRGAAAVLGASTLVQHNSVDDLARRLGPLVSTPGMTLGEAVVLAKRQSAAVSQQRRDVLVGWTLLGDPAMVVEQP